MPDNGSPPRSEELFHTHHDMTRQLEQLQEKASLLRRSEVESAAVLNELFEFADQFATTVIEHIAEEEETIFPRCQPYLTVAARAMLYRIHEQHRELETSLDVLLEQLKIAQLSPEDLETDLVESIYIRSRLLRYNFILHSADERQFFEEVLRFSNPE